MNFSMVVENLWWLLRNKIHFYNWIQIQMLVVLDIFKKKKKKQ